MDFALISLVAEQALDDDQVEVLCSGSRIKVTLSYRGRIRLVKELTATRRERNFRRTAWTWLEEEAALLRACRTSSNAVESSYLWCFGHWS